MVSPVSNMIAWTLIILSLCVIIVQYKPNPVKWINNVILELFIELEND